MYPLQDKKQLLIEGYLQGSLVGSQQTDFEQLLEIDNEFIENTLLERIIKDALAEAALEEQLLLAENDENFAEFNALLAELDESCALQHQLDTWLNGSGEAAPGQSGYSTREELEKQFAPVAEYERVLASSHRANNEDTFDVLLPYNGTKCHNRTLVFNLSPSANADTEIIKLRIENNQKCALIKQNITPNTTQFTILLANEQFPAGRYYWKLLKGDEMIIREFFIWDN